jgi:hypothetical protein
MSFRRQFNEVLESKLVKLIFNGQICDDEKKLSDYGLASNAVVHCLILQKRSAPITSQPALQTNQNPNNFLSSSLNGTFFIYILGMVLVSLTLIGCWYAR